VTKAFLVPKPGCPGRWRLVFDFRHLNTIYRTHAVSALTLTAPGRRRAARGRVRGSAASLDRKRTLSVDRIVHAAPYCYARYCYALGDADELPELV
jgi:hypothetical protein